jgi:hypothetical protein
MRQRPRMTPETTEGWLLRYGRSMLDRLSRLLRRIGRRATPEESFERQRDGRERLTAEYTESFAKDQVEHRGIRETYPPYPW